MCSIIKYNFNLVERDSGDDILFFRRVNVKKKKKVMF